MTLSAASVRLWIFTIDPTSTDDESKNYEVGNFWFNSTSIKMFHCVDVTTNAAVWIQYLGSGITPEYGTFSPELQFGGASTGITYATQSGYYFVHNAKVDFWIDIALMSKGSATGDATVANIPYTNGTIDSVCSFAEDDLDIPGTYNSYAALVHSSNSYVTLYAQGILFNRIPLTNAEFNNDSILHIYGAFLM